MLKLSFFLNMYFVPLKQMITQSRYNHQYKLFLLMRVRELVNQASADPKPAINFTCPVFWDCEVYTHAYINEV